MIFIDAVMFKEEESLLSRHPAPPLDGLCPMESSMEKADGTHHPARGDPTSEEAALGFHLPPYPSAYSSPLYPVALGMHDEYFPKPDARADDPGGDGRAPRGGALPEHHAGFESLELGFTELLPPQYPHGRAGRPPSPSPWLDSPYLSSSPSPSHSSSLSPFPAGSPISGSPLPPSGPHFSAYAQQEMCPSPPPLHPPPGSSYQDFYYPPPYSQYDGGCWDPPQGRGVAPGGGRWAEGEQAQAQAQFSGSSSAAMHHITLEEGENRPS